MFSAFLLHLLSASIATYIFLQKYDSDDEITIDDDSSLSKDSKIVKFSSTSMRTDMILKSALGVARK